MQITCDYIDMINNGGKRWLLPRKDIRNAMCLYQPSSIQGKLVKSTIPFVEHMPVIRVIANHILNIKDIKFALDSIMLRKIQSAFDVREYDDLSLALFMGTPGTHNKTTIQVVNKGKILGYCKVSESDDIFELFSNEKKVLEQLEVCCVRNVPRCLYCGQLKNGQYMFVQDTVKSKKSKVLHELSDVHFSFLRELFEKTRIICNFEDSDYDVMLSRLKEEKGLISRSGYSLEDINFIEEAISLVRKLMHKVNVFCAYHGDFTPWNMFVEDSQLFVFDFEYAKLSYPAYLDLFHYFVQTAIYENKMSAEKIDYAFKNRLFYRFKNVMDNPYLYFLAYLLSVVELYIQREDGFFDEEMMHTMTIRIGLIKMIISRKELFGCV